MTRERVQCTACPWREDAQDRMMQWVGSVNLVSALLLSGVAGRGSQGANRRQLTFRNINRSQAIQNTLELHVTRLQRICLHTLEQSHHPPRFPHFGPCAVDPTPLTRRAPVHYGRGPYHAGPRWRRWTSPPWTMTTKRLQGLALVALVPTFQPNVCTWLSCVG